MIWSLQKSLIAYFCLKMLSDETQMKTAKGNNTHISCASFTSSSFPLLPLLLLLMGIREVWCISFLHSTAISSLLKRSVVLFRWHYSNSKTKSNYIEQGLRSPLFWDLLNLLQFLLNKAG